MQETAPCSMNTRHIRIEKSSVVTIVMSEILQRLKARDCNVFLSSAFHTNAFVAGEQNSFVSPVASSSHLLVPV